MTFGAFSIYAVIASLVGILFAGYLAMMVLKLPPGNKRMIEIYLNEKLLKFFFKIINRILKKRQGFLVNPFSLLVEPFKILCKIKM